MQGDTFDLVVVGGGAAGFYGAIQAASMKPGLKVLILEKSSKLLSKVRISGGGRCNVTHDCFNPSRLAQHYPRGEKALKMLFKSYHAGHVVEWFHSRGVELKTEDDGRMFPTTNSSESIINCFTKEAERLNIQIQVSSAVTKIRETADDYSIEISGGRMYRSQKILIASGGNANVDAYGWIVHLGHSLIKPIPSLFTFNDSDRSFADLMGIAVPSAEVRIAGTKFSENGPLLITHWGLSGPAVIKLSSWAAQYLYENGYQFTALVSWIGSIKEEELRAQLLELKKQREKQRITSNPIFALPSRLWQRLCQLAEIEETKIWAEISHRNLNKLLEHIMRCPFKIKGKTTFKEEFVTCGGIDLKELDLSTMESKLMKNVHFAGEVLNIDGETGGFNFQSAWTTAYIAARGITNNFAQDTL